MGKLFHGLNRVGNCKIMEPVTMQYATLIESIFIAAVTALILVVNWGKQRGFATLKGVWWLQRGISVTLASCLRLFMRMLRAL